MTATAADNDAFDLPKHFFLGLWAAAGLGIIVQAIVIFVRYSAGQPPTMVQVAIDLAGGISWSVVVCGALSLGVTASRQFGEFSMGLLGLLGAPAGFSVAKAAQRGVQWLADRPIDQLGPIVFATAGLRALEYGLLGYGLYKLIGTPRSTVRNHVALGAAVGTLFGGAIVFANVRMATAPLPAFKQAGIAVNEVIFPIGCSLLIFWLARITRTGTGAIKQLFTPN